MAPTPIVVVDGILIFAQAALREMFDVRIYVDTDPDIRLARRLVRDVAERGRTYEFGLDQYLRYTRPMHNQFVEPSKRFADLIIPEGGHNQTALSIVLSHIDLVLQKNGSTT